VTGEGDGRTEAGLFAKGLIGLKSPAFRQVEIPRALIRLYRPSCRGTASRTLLIFSARPNQEGYGKPYPYN
jgi:hypothetical protein